MLAEGQWQIRNLVMGRGTAYRTMDDTNPFTLVIDASQTGKRAWSHGSWSGAEWAAERTVPMRLLVEATDVASAVAAHQRLAAAFAPVEDSTEDVECRFRLGDAEYVLFGRPRLVEPEMELLGTGKYFARCAFAALDPLIYSAQEHSVVLGLPQAAGGLTVPLTLPVSIAATVASGRARIPNAGTGPGGMRLRIDGPVAGPRAVIVNTRGTTTIRCWMDLDVAQWLEIDTGARTAYLNGTASRRGNITVDGPGWPLLHGDQVEVAFAAAEYSESALLTVTWRDAWW